MPWHVVIIEKFDVTAADLAGDSLIKEFCRESGAACADSSVEVWHRKDAETIRRFYFSPAAAGSAPATLKKFRSQLCPEKPDLAGLAKKLPI
jgi:hypothetical protein